MSPDGWIRYYYERRDSAGAAAFNIADAAGWVLAPKCAKCDGRKRYQNETLEWICARKRCITNGERTRWPLEPALVARGIVQTSMRKDHGEGRMGKYLDLGRELQRFLLEYGTVGRIYVAAALGHSRVTIAEQGPRAWPADMFPWSEWHVRSAIREGREAWMKHLVRVHLA